MKTLLVGPPFLDVAQIQIDMMHSLQAGHQLGPYEIVRALGKGGMGEIYVALDRRLARTVAIKLLPADVYHNAEAVERFRREARAASALNHPHIVTIYDIGDCERGLFIAMELIEGQTLREIGREEVAAHQLAAWGEQIGRALAASHEAGVSHRDIKPENIMIRKDGYAKVLDFGLASLTSSADVENTATAALTTAGAVMGTLRYMSPEQARGERCGPASDIFSLGIVLYELATGHHPFAGETALIVVHSILSNPVKPPRTLRPDLPDSVDHVLLAMLDKSENRRPKATEVAAAFSDIAKSRNGAEPEFGSRSRRCTVGRDAEREQLREAFRGSLNGAGSVIAIAGEPGIGKSTLAEDFLTEAASSGTNCLIARGRCSERLAGTEAYLPVLEAMGSMLQDAGREMVAPIMRSVSPSWYMQLASLDPGDSSAAHLLAEVKSGSQERMKRELGLFLQEVAKQQPLIVFLDDLHWADPSTVDALSYIAGRITTSRILLLATYRLTDMLLVKHPMLRVKGELQAHGRFKELHLDFLSRVEIEQYLAIEFPAHRFGTAIAEMIHAKTEGNALFMTDLVRYLRDRGVVAQSNEIWVLVQQLPEVERDLPQSVRAMVDQKIARLQERDVRLLTAASVQGYVFDSAIVADVLKEDPAEVEERLNDLEQVHRFVHLVEEAELPDRTLNVRYRFVHVLYQNALQGSLRPTRRATLSKAIGDALLTRHASHAESIANELAVLFQSGRDFLRSAEFYRTAAQHAAAVFASQEAVALARRGVATVESAPESAERSRAELALLITLGNSLIATAGYAAAEVTEAFTRAREICESLGEKPMLFPVLYGEWVSEFVSGNNHRSLELSRRFLNLALEEGNEAVVVGFRMMGWGQFCTGNIEASRESFDEAIAIWTPECRRLAFHYGHEPGMAACLNQALALWLLGSYPEAEARYLQALRLADEVNHTNSRSYAMVFAAVYCCWRGDYERALMHAEAAVAMASDQGLALWKGWGAVLAGRALAGLGMVADIPGDLRGAYDAAVSTGAGLFGTYHLSILAEVHLSQGLFDQSMRDVDEALALSERNDERFWFAELYRLRGEVILGSGGAAEQAMQAFIRALEIARAQNSRSLHLRAALSIARTPKLGDTTELEAAVSAFASDMDSLELAEARLILEKAAQPRVAIFENR